MKFLIVFVVSVIIISFGPILCIWALNTLFPQLDIPYNLRTWVATIIAVAAIRGFNLSQDRK